MHVLERVEVVTIPHDRSMASIAMWVRHGSIISRTDRQIDATDRQMSATAATILRTIATKSAGDDFGAAPWTTAAR